MFSQSSPADITNAGGLSPYGTMAQNGNLYEWGESGLTSPNDSAGESRVVRGGHWYNSNSVTLASSFRISINPAGEDSDVGFRVAAIPEPSGFLLSLILTMSVVMRRKRG